MLRLAARVRKVPFREVVRWSVVQVVVVVVAAGGQIPPPEN